MFTKKLKLFSLVLCCFFSISFIRSTSEVEDIQNLTKEIKKSGEETLDFLGDFDTALPQLAQEISNSKGFNLTFITTILNLYKNVRISELLQFTVLQKNGMDKRLIPFLIYVVIESFRIASISNLENKKIYMPLQNSSNYNRNIKEITELNKTIDNYIEKINEKTISIKNNLKTILKNQFGLDLPEIQNLDLESNQNSDGSLKKLLEKINYKKLMEALNVKKDELIEEFEIFIVLIGDKILNATDIATLENLTDGSVFQKIKQNTTLDKLEKVYSGLLSSVSNTAQNTFSWLKNNMISTKK